MLYFAYGSNMSTARIQVPERCPGAECAGSARLPGYRVVFDKPTSPTGRWHGALAANLRPDATAETWGVLWHITSAHEQLQLRQGERGYDEVTLTVYVDGRAVEAVAYIAPRGTEGPTSSEYLSTLIEGAEDHLLPTAYIDMLRAVRTSEAPR